MPGLFWNETFTNQKGTESHAFRAGEPLQRYNFVKREDPTSFNVILATTASEAIGYVLCEVNRTVQIGETVEVLFGEWKTGFGEGGSGFYTPSGETTAEVGGIELGTDLGTDPVTIQSILDMMLYPDLGPTVNLQTNPLSGLYEKGDDQTNVLLTSVIDDGALPLTQFTFSKTGSGVIFTDPTPTPGTENYTDVPGVTDTTTYTATVTDGTNTATASKTFTFVAAYYYGVDSPGLDISSDGGGLTKVVQDDTPVYAANFSPTAQVYYFAYPSAHPALSSILDDNGFETIADWTVTLVDVTNSFGHTEQYRQYEFNNLTTQTNFTNTFIQ